jgi:SAM-dependent methyltransferase
MKQFLKSLVPPVLRPIIRSAWHRAYHWGFRHTCPFCRSHLRTFLPFGLKAPVLGARQVVGAGYRLNARCPFCGSIDRERLLYLFLLRKTDIFERRLRVLHVAPEAGVSAILSCTQTVDYVTADLQSEQVMVRMDITDIQFPDDHFDAIICNHVLEHVVDDRRAMSELFRTLRPGGWAILQVPISMASDRTYEDPLITTPDQREMHFGQGDHVRIYGADYKDRLEQAGFEVELFKWTSDRDAFGGSANTFGLNDRESVYFARKRP